MPFIPAIAAIANVAMTGYSIYSGEVSRQVGEKQAKAAQAQGAAGLLEQQDFNQRQLDLQNKALTQQGVSQSILSGSGMDTTPSMESDNGILPGAEQMLSGKQPNVYSWV